MVYPKYKGVRALLLNFTLNFFLFISTSLYRRTRFQQRVQVLLQVGRVRRPLIVVLIDKFKYLNEREIKKRDLF